MTYLIKETAFRLSSFSLPTLNIEFRIKLSVSNLFKKYFLKKYKPYTLIQSYLHTKKVKSGDDLPPPLPPKGKSKSPALHVSPFVFCFFVFVLYFIFIPIYLFYFISLFYFNHTFFVHDIFVIPTFHRTFPKPSPES